MAKVFISHADQDKPLIRPIIGALRDLGLEVWFDEEQLTLAERIGAQLEQALCEAGCVVVFWSANSAASHWVRQETDTALNLGKLVQVLLEPDVVDRLHSALRMTLHERYYLADSSEKRADANKRIAAAARGRLAVWQRLSARPTTFDPTHVPFAINREPQLDQIKGDLHDLLKIRAVHDAPAFQRPAYILFGKRHDCPDRLADRLHVIEGPRLFEDAKANEWLPWTEEIAEVQWSTDGNADPVDIKNRTENKIRAYNRFVRSPCCVFSHIVKVRPNEGDFVQQWFETWNAHFSGNPKSPAVPLLVINSADSSFWPFASASSRGLKSIGSVINQWRSKASASVKALRLASLEPVTAKDARRWASRCFHLPKVRAAASAHVDLAFRSDDAKLNLAEFAKGVKQAAWFRELS